MNEIAEVPPPTKCPNHAPHNSLALVAYQSWSRHLQVRWAVPQGARTSCRCFTRVGRKCSNLSNR